MDTPQHLADHSGDPHIEDRPETPPPPYQLEDYAGNAFDSSHDPESTALSSDVPYAFRG